MIAQATTDENQPNKGDTAGNRQSADRKAGGQPGNRNGLRHGLFASKSPYSYIDKMVNRFRRALEDAVVDAHGKVSVADAALIHSATEATRAALANRRRLADVDGKLTPELLIAFDRAHLAALDLRDRKVAGLNLPASGKVDPYAALYETPIPAA
ncbi:MAG: hypothetical protein IID44_07205 [Planctomycetes bacterium]|nr:hypothetical protein [Planctomycetota bacterium]